MTGIHIYAKKHQVTDLTFLRCLKIDGFITIMRQKTTINIFETDTALSKADYEYNSENATYKGKPCSMNEYVKIKYGFNAVGLIQDLIA
jgi:hypothetical protein